MESATSKSLSKHWRLALVGLSTAFAWVILALLLGLGSGDARAADGDDTGLLGAVTSAVDRTASTVTDTVSTVTGGVTETVDTVVNVAPAPAQSPVREVVQSVGTVVTTVTEPVTEIVAGGVVGGVTQPVVDIVTAVPVLGDVVSGVGLDTAVTDLGQTVDDTLGGVVGAVEEAGSAVGQPTPAPQPTPSVIPAAPEATAPIDVADVSTAITPEPSATASGTVALANAAAAASTLSALVVVETPQLASPSETISSSTDPSGVRGPYSLGGGLCPFANSSPGSSGAGPGAGALLASGPLDAYRAWVRLAGHEDELAPPAPVLSTDVSPD